jgi:hypothetical protein
VSTAIEAPPIINGTQTTPSSFQQGLRLFRVRFWNVTVFAWKYVVGMAFCQFFLGSILIVGWTYRLMQRVVYKRWWQRSDMRSNGVSFQQFLADDPATQAHRHWPNWLVEQNFFEAVRRRPLKALVNSLWLNFRIGFQGIFNTWVLTLPGCALMLFSWYDGWNNSFNKGYEQAAVGPLTGLSGLFLFILAMLYVPMGQARQAATGNWRSFYQFRLVWRLVLRHWPACLGLAILYSALCVPVTVFRILPQSFPQMDKLTPEFLATLTNAQIVADLNRYYFKVGALIFVAYVFLRLVAARIYATGLLSAVEQGVVPVEALAENERTQLQRLNLLRVRTTPPRHVLIRLVGKTVTWGFWGVATFAMALVWFSFVAQLYIAQFMNYIPGIGWLNQPLVQLPLFHFIPGLAK